MSQVRDVVHQCQLFSVEEHQSVAEVARAMAGFKVGAILVLKERELAGVFSERDLMMRVVLERRDPDATLVSEVMTTNVCTIEEDAAPEEAMEAMQSNNCRHLPVTRDGHVVAFLSMRDLMNYEVARQTEEIVHMRAYISNA